MIRRLLLILSVATLAACMTIGTKFDPSVVDRLVPGVSTTADATTLLGKPNSTSTYSNGTTLLQWQYSQGTPVGGNGAHVAILFDAQGKMIRVTHRFQT